MKSFHSIPRFVVLSSFALFLGTVSCGQSTAKSNLKITNGIKKQPDRLKAVISQDGCTGTFVSPTTILTAAHCADKGFTYKGVRTKSFQSMPEATGKPWGFDIDVRVLVFPEAVAPAWIPVSTETVKGDESVMFAGFGTYDLKDHKNDGQFRYGTGKLSGFEADNKLIASYGTDLEKIEGTEGTNSGVGPGDSGGPLLRDGLLIGIASAVSGIGNDRHKSVHVNLTHPAIVSFLKEAIVKGADIRFDGEGTIPFEECFKISAQNKETSVKFEVPHRHLVSVTGKWSICKDCAPVDGTGIKEGKYADYRPIFSNIPAAALLFSSEQKALDPLDDSSVIAWKGESILLEEMNFGATFRIHDKDVFSDNKGTLTACFR